MLYTIGYANKAIDEFLSILKQNKIEFLIDVRTTPFSKMFSDYNKNKLKDILAKKGIKYSHMPQYFGAQRTEPSLYSTFLNFRMQYENIVDFEKVYQNEEFINGVARIVNGLEKSYNICFMCSEKYPYDCHRNIMVANYFNKKYGYEIYNIIDKNTIMIQGEVVEWCAKNFIEKSNKFLKKISTLSEINLFGEDSNTKEEKELIEFIDSNITLNEKALKLRNIEIGYKNGDEEND